MQSYCVFTCIIIWYTILLSTSKPLPVRNSISSPDTPLTFLKNAISKSVVDADDMEQSFRVLDLFFVQEPPVALSHHQNINSILQRSRRAIVPLSMCVFNSPSLNIYINSIPPLSCLPLHSRPGQVLGAVLEGNNHVEIREIVIDATTLSDSRNRGGVIVAQEDAFALTAEEDCVCRGGVCPRRYGCVFWIEKQLRDQQGYMTGRFRPVALMQHRLDDSHNGDSPRICFAFPDHVHLQPREFLNRDDKFAAILLEIVISGEDLVERVADMQFYRTDHCESSTDPAVSGTDCSVHVFSSERPLGPAPVHLDMHISAD